jgi:UDP-N-acetylglucosamine transferase subunit ALG13
MVFISVGTQKQSFKRLFHLVEESKILEGKKIVAQSGYTEYSSDKIDMFKFMDNETYKNYMNEAEIVICHGGVGTIFDALYSGKKVLVVPRLAKYEEHVNDHQIEICEELEKQGYLLYLKEFDIFDDVLKKLINSNFKKYVPDDNYLKILRKEI